MTHVGRCVTSKGIKPIVKYQHAFKNTYLYGSFSPINGDSFVYEIEGTTSEIFHQYLVEFSKHKPKELKIIIIDNAGFHSMRNFKIPQNIKLIRIPPYSPELNPSEKIGAYIKQFYKNKVFENLSNVKAWLHNFIKLKLNQEIIQGITHNPFYNQIFMMQFEI
jgi:transposase